MVERMWLVVPLTMPRTAVTRLAPRSQTSGPSSGTPPATAASKRRPTPASRAAASRALPCLASSSLLAVTTDLPAARAARMASPAASVPPMSSTTTSTSWAVATDIASSVRRTSGGQLQLALAGSVARGHGHERGRDVAAGHGIGSPVRRRAAGRPRPNRPCRGPADRHAGPGAAGRSEGPPRCLADPSADRSAGPRSDRPAPCGPSARPC